MPSPIESALPAWCCPECDKPVGYVGRVMAWLLGNGSHGCDYRLLHRCRLYEYQSERVDRISSEVDRIRRALAADIDGPLAPELQAANQALSWALEPQSAVAPFLQIIDRRGISNE